MVIFLVNFLQARAEHANGTSALAIREDMLASPYERASAIVVVLGCKNCRQGLTPYTNR